MLKNYKIKEPFFEIGPKTYVYGKQSLDIALAAQEASLLYKVSVIYTPQYTDLREIALSAPHLHIFAQHMDPIRTGRGIGAVLPEAIKEAGAQGVLLNHAERKMSFEDLRLAIEIADEIGLATMVCADTLDEALLIAHLHPNIILAEPTSLIGKSNADLESRTSILEINRAINSIDSKIQIMHSAGISGPNDVISIIQAGADATGVTSAVFKAFDPIASTKALIQAVRVGYDQRKATRNGS
jgi:triosephosphate isomerase